MRYLLPLIYDIDGYLVMYLYLCLLSHLKEHNSSINVQKLILLKRTNTLDSFYTCPKTSSICCNDLFLKTVFLYYILQGRRQPCADHQAQLQPERSQRTGYASHSGWTGRGYEQLRLDAATSARASAAPASSDPSGSLCQRYASLHGHVLHRGGCHFAHGSRSWSWQTCWRLQVSSACQLWFNKFKYIYRLYTNCSYNIRSTDDISSGYSSAEPVSAPLGSGLSRTSSMTNASKARAKSKRNEVGSINVPRVLSEVLPYIGT